MMLEKQTSGKVPILYLFALCAVCAVCYARTLPYPFVYDDKPVLRDVPAYRNPLNTRDVFTRSYFDTFAERTYRPVNTLSFFIDSRLWGMSPRGSRAANIVLHAIISMLIFGILSELLKNRAAAFFGAAVFAAHPVHSEAVILVSNREELLCALFFFAAVYVHALWMRRGARTGAFLALFIVSCALSMFSKEMAAGIPFAVALSALCFRRENPNASASLRASMPFIISSCATVAAFLALRYTIFRNPVGEVSWPGGSPFATLLTMSRVFFDYAGLIAYPARMCALHVVQPSVAFSGAAAVSVTGLFALIAVSLFLIRSRPRAAYVPLFFFMTWLPVSNIIPFGELMAERYIYIPSFAFSFAVALYFVKLRGRVPVILLSASAVLILSASTILRAPAWNGDMALWSDTVSCAPHGSTGRLNLGNAYASRGDYAKALDEYLAASGCPDLKEPHKIEYNRGISLLALGRLHEAEQAFRAAAEIDASFALPHLNLGSLHEKHGSIVTAAGHFKRAAEIAPNNAQVQYAAGRFFLIHGGELNSFPAAVRLLKKSSELDPGAADTHAALAAAFLSSGDKVSAAREIAAALSIDPENKAALSMSYSAKIKIDLKREAIATGAGLSKVPAALALIIIVICALSASLFVRELSMEGSRV